MQVRRVAIEGESWWRAEGDVADCGCAEFRIDHDERASFFVSGYELDELIRLLLNVRREIRHGVTSSAT